MFCRDGGLRRIKAAYLTDDQIIHMAAFVAFLALIARSVFHRRHRHRPAHLQADRSRAARRRRPRHRLGGILPVGRAAVPTARAALAAFDGLCATYTTGGLVLDRLTQTQRMILALLNIPPPWPEDTSEAGNHDT